MSQDVPDRSSFVKNQRWMARLETIVGCIHVEQLTFGIIYAKL